jgi:hypothetical protein
MQSHWSTWSWYGAEPDSEARTLSVDCPADVKTVRATLSTNATAGEIAFLLVDPAGIERHRETVRGGNREAVLTWPGSEGAWRLEVTPKDFSGYYSVELCAHDKPIQVGVRMAGRCRALGQRPRHRSLDYRSCGRAFALTRSPGCCRCETDTTRSKWVGS